MINLTYILGGYILASKTEINKELNNTNFGGLNLNNFATALAVNNYTINNLEEKSYSLDSFDAYDSFLNNKSNSLCGTQRDAFRLNNKIENGKIQNLNFEYLTSFSDLIQYLSIAKCNYNEIQICTKFIEYITSKDTQETLKNINMFNVLQNRSDKV